MCKYSVTDQNIHRPMKWKYLELLDNEHDIVSNHDTKFDSLQPELYSYRVATENILQKTLFLSVI